MNPSNTTPKMGIEIEVNPPTETEVNDKFIEPKKKEKKEEVIQMETKLKSIAFATQKTKLNGNKNNTKRLLF